MDGLPEVELAAVTKQNGPVPGSGVLPDWKGPVPA